MNHTNITHYFLMNKGGYIFSVEKSLDVDIEAMNNNGVQFFPNLDELYTRAAADWDVPREEVECEIQFKQQDGKVIMIDPRGIGEVWEEDDETLTEYIINFII